MQSYVQLLTFIVSFVYGILFNFFTKVNYKYLFNKNFYIKIIFNIVYVFDVVLLYLFILLKLSNGYFHVYFLIFIILGYFFGEYVNNKLKNVKFKRLIEQIKSKCYTKHSR